VFGVDSMGRPTEESLDAISREDPADIANKVARYIDAPTFEIESIELKKRGHKLQGLLMSGSAIPHIFQAPTTRVAESKKRRLESVRSISVTELRASTAIVSLRTFFGHSRAHFDPRPHLTIDCAQLACLPNRDRCYGARKA
jgi:hypothetical protein